MPDVAFSIPTFTAANAAAINISPDADPPTIAMDDSLLPSEAQALRQAAADFDTACGALNITAGGGQGNLATRNADVLTQWGILKDARAALASKAVAGAIATLRAPGATSSPMTTDPTGLAAVLYALVYELLG